MKPISIVNEITPEEIYVEIIMGSTCNFNCSYCFPGCNDGKYRWPIGKQQDIFYKNLIYIFDVFKEYGKKNFIINVTGGEPTLWPGLGNFAKFFKETYGARVIMSSNGSRTLRWWEENAKYFSGINISVHNEEVDVDHTIQVLDWIYLNTDTSVRASVLMDIKNWDKCKNIVDKLQAHDVPWLLNAGAVMVGDDMIDYSKEQLEYLQPRSKKIPPKEYIEKMKEKNNIVIRDNKIFTVYEDGSREQFSSVKWYANNWHRLEGWECNLGVERFYIWMDGDIKGGCGATNLFNRTVPLNIYDESLPNKFFLKDILPLICKYKACVCSSELQVNKRKVND
jgi:organic radical activating enzyme